MKHQTMREQVWALSALLLAIECLERLSSEGKIEEAANLALLPSLIRFNQPRIEDYYDNHFILERGQKILAKLWQANQQNQTRLYYCARIMHGEKKLMKHQTVLKILRKRLEDVQRQTEYFPLNHENIIANFACIYAETVGKLTGRIQVKGKKEHLIISQNIDHVRTLLLCMVRAVSLWRFYGGSKWQFIFYRKDLQKVIENTSFSLID